MSQCNTFDKRTLVRRRRSKLTAWRTLSCELPRFWWGAGVLGSRFFRRSLLQTKWWIVKTNSATLVIAEPVWRVNASVLTPAGVATSWVLPSPGFVGGVAVGSNCDMECSPGWQQEPSVVPELTTRKPTTVDESPSLRLDRPFPGTTPLPSIPSSKPFHLSSYQRTPSRTPPE